jgi:hypothetical protein
MCDGAWLSLHFSDHRGYAVIKRKPERRILLLDVFQAPFHNEDVGIVAKKTRAHVY